MPFLNVFPKRVLTRLLSNGFSLGQVTSPARAGSPEVSVSRLPFDTGRGGSVFGAGSPTSGWRRVPPASGLWFPLSSSETKALKLKF